MELKIIERYYQVSSFGIHVFLTLEDAKQYINNEALTVYNILECTKYEDSSVNCCVIESKNWVTPSV